MAVRPGTRVSVLGEVRRSQRITMGIAVLTAVAGVAALVSGLAE